MLSDELLSGSAPAYHFMPEYVKDVIDSADMEIKYDGDKQMHFVTQEVELAPKEVRTIKLKVRNVWRVPDEELQRIRAEMEQKIRSLQNTKYADTGELLYEKVNDMLSLIEEEQAKKIGIKRRVELFRSHRKQLEMIRGEMVSLETLQMLKDEQEFGVRTTKFVIKAANPANEPREMMVRSLLPKGIETGDVLEKLKFDVLYDEEEKRYALELKDEFAAKENKRYEVVLRDIWYIPQPTLDSLSERTEQLAVHFVGSSYDEFAAQNATFIYESIAEIEALQAEVGDSNVLADRIRASVLNNQRLSIVKRKIMELQDLLLELPIMRKDEDILKKLVHAVREFQRVADLRKLLSMGLVPDYSATWWIILGIVLFLGVVSTGFYMSWLKKLKQNVWKKQTTEL